MEVRPTLLERILEGQRSDVQLQLVRHRITSDQDGDFTIGGDDSIRHQGRLFVPDQPELREEILTKAHRTPYTVHPGGTKMYKDLKQTFWWPKLKNDVARFVAHCLVCQHVKAEEDQRPAGKLHPLPIPQWKWEWIIMDFVTGLPRS